MDLQTSAARIVALVTKLGEYVETEKKEALQLIGDRNRAIADLEGQVSSLKTQLAEVMAQLPDPKMIEKISTTLDQLDSAIADVTGIIDSQPVAPVSDLVTGATLTTDSFLGAKMLQDAAIDLTPTEVEEPEGDLL